jgi:hypothetical protein
MVDGFELIAKTTNPANFINQLSTIHYQPAFESQPLAKERHCSLEN